MKAKNRILFHLLFLCSSQILDETEQMNIILSKNLSVGERKPIFVAIFTRVITQRTVDIIFRVIARSWETSSRSSPNFFLENRESIPAFPWKYQNKSVSLFSLNIKTMDAVFENINVNVPRNELSFFKQFIEKMGWQIVSKKDSLERFIESCPKDLDISDEEIMKEVAKIRYGKE